MEFAGVLVHARLKAFEDGVGGLFSSRPNEVSTGSCSRTNRLYSSSFGRETSAARSNDSARALECGQRRILSLDQSPSFLPPQPPETRLAVSRTINIAKFQITVLSGRIQCHSAQKLETSSHFSVPLLSTLQIDQNRTSLLLDLLN